MGSWAREQSRAVERSKLPTSRRAHMRAWLSSMKYGMRSRSSGASQSMRRGAWYGRTPGTRPRAQRRPGPTHSQAPGGPLDRAAVGSFGVVPPPGGPRGALVGSPTWSKRSPNCGHWPTTLAHDIGPRGGEPMDGPNDRAGFPAVHEEGLEPPRLTAAEPKSAASANSATRASSPASYFESAAS